MNNFKTNDLCDVIGLESEEIYRRPIEFIFIGKPVFRFDFKKLNEVFNLQNTLRDKGAEVDVNYYLNMDIINILDNEYSYDEEDLTDNSGILHDTLHHFRNDTLKIVIYMGLESNVYFNQFHDPTCAGDCVDKLINNYNNFERLVDYVKDRLDFYLICLSIPKYNTAKFSEKFNYIVFGDFTLSQAVNQINNKLCELSFINPNLSIITDYSIQTEYAKQKRCFKYYFNNSDYDILSNCLVEDICYNFCITRCCIELKSTLISYQDKYNSNYDELYDRVRIILLKYSTIFGESIIDGSLMFYKTRYKKLFMDTPKNEIVRVFKNLK